MSSVVVTCWAPLKDAGARDVYYTNHIALADAGVINYAVRTRAVNYPETVDKTNSCC